MTKQEKEEFVNSIITRGPEFESAEEFCFELLSIIISTVEVTNEHHIYNAVIGTISDVMMKRTVN